MTADGRKPGVLQRVWGGVGQVAELIKRPDFPDGIIREGGHALALNGRDQFVELPKDVADFRECSYTVEFKWAGGVSGARLFEFANPNGDAVLLCPAELGRLVFAIRQGEKIDFVAAPAVAPNVWTNVQVVIAGNRATLSVNGKQVAENKTLSLTPDAVRATQCYLGRGLKGNYFNGLIGRFTIRCPGSNG